MKDILQKTSKKVKKKVQAQILYLNTIGNSFEELKRNYPAAEKMDNILGTEEYTGDLDVKRTKESKDKNRLKKCPIYK